MEIVNDSNQYIINYKPVGKRMVGVCFMLFSLIPLYGFLGGFSNFNKLSSTVIGIGLLIGIGVFLGGFVMFLKAKSVDFSINKTMKNIAMTEKGIFGTNNYSYGFSDVRQFKIVEYSNAPHGTIDHFILELKDNSERLLSIQPNTTKDEMRTKKSEFVELNNLI